MARRPEHCTDRVERRSFIRDNRSSFVRSGLEECEHTVTLAGLTGSDVDVMILDWSSPASRLEHPTVPDAVLHSCHAVLVVYDVTDSATFELVGDYLEVATAAARPGASLLVLGNKCDKRDQTSDAEFGEEGSAEGSADAVPRHKAEALAVRHS